MTGTFAACVPATPTGARRWWTPWHGTPRGSSYAGWRQHTAQALAAWSVQAPRTADALEVDAVLQLSDGDAVEEWCRLFGMAVPVERELTAEDQAAIARATLAEAAERKRKRRSVDVAW